MIGRLAGCSRERHRTKQQKLWEGGSSKETIVRRYARERLHRPRNQTPWAIKSSSVLVGNKGGTRGATGSGVALDYELKQLKIAHICQLANNEGISEFRPTAAKQAPIADLP